MNSGGNSRVGELDRQSIIPAGANRHLDPSAPTSGWDATTIGWTSQPADAPLVISFYGFEVPAVRHFSGGFRLAAGGGGARLGLLPPFGTKPSRWSWLVPVATLQNHSRDDGAGQRFVRQLNKPIASMQFNVATARPAGTMSRRLLYYEPF